MSRDSMHKLLGFSLVELMVALVISSLLLTGVIQIFISSKQSYGVVDGYSRLQENARFAVEFLTKNIRIAGYKPDAWESAQTAFPSVGVYTNNGQIIFGIDNGANPDVITFRFQGNGDGFAEDCLGNSNPVVKSVTFSVDTDNSDGNVNELECSVNGGAPQPLIDGVENMQILYGIDTSGDLNVNQFKSADTVSNVEWNNVVGVRIGLLVNTIEAVNQQSDPNSFNLLGANIPAQMDRLRRRRFVTTINLRNRTF